MVGRQPQICNLILATCPHNHEHLEHEQTVRSSSGFWAREYWMCREDHQREGFLRCDDSDSNRMMASERRWEEEEEKEKCVKRFFIFLPSWI